MVRLISPYINEELNTISLNILTLPISKSPVRHRAQELSELLNNTDRIQEERKKARENKNKYSGVSSDQVRGGSLGPSSGGKYGGFGSQTVPNGGAESMYNSQ